MFRSISCMASCVYGKSAAPILPEWGCDIPSCLSTWAECAGLESILHSRVLPGTTETVSWTSGMSSASSFSAPSGSSWKSFKFSVTSVTRKTCKKKKKNVQKQTAASVTLEMTKCIPFLYTSSSQCLLQWGSFQTQLGHNTLFAITLHYKWQSRLKLNSSASAYTSLIIYLNKTTQNAVDTNRKSREKETNKWETPKL